MTIADLMSGRTPSSSYEGWVTADDMVLAVDCNSSPKTGWTPADVATFSVAEVGASGVTSALNPITADKTYIRAGKSTMKTGNQRSFAISGDRYIGDDFQDFCMGHAVKYGTGTDCVRKYVYFNIRSGKGESGEVAIIVDSDGSGEAGSSAAFAVNLMKSGSAPADYTYAAPTP